MLVNAAPSHADPSAPSAPAGTTAVRTSSTSGNFVSDSGAVVGGWAEFPASAAKNSKSGSGSTSAVLATPDQAEDGGTWTYGDYVSGSYKYCYSDYLNGTYEHSATVEMNPAPTVKDVELPGFYAYAETKYYANKSGICYAYWDVYGN